MEKNRIKVTVAGNTYTILSDEPVAYVEQLGREVDEILTESITKGHLSPVKAAVLALLDERDRAHKAEEAMDNLRTQVRQYAEENATLRTKLGTARRG